MLCSKHASETAQSLADPPHATNDIRSLLDLLDDTLRSEAQYFINTVPRAGQLTDSSLPFDQEYYIRHRIETVRRIRLTAKTDALALASMIDEDYDSARYWSQYTTEELQHDKLYLSDLKKHGYSVSDIFNSLPLSSTVALIEFLENKIKNIGSIAAVSYSIVVEWNSARYSAPAVDRAEHEFGKQKVKGSKAHLAIDINEDHYNMMVKIAYRLLQVSADTPTLIMLIRNICHLFRNYFVELHNLSSETA